MTTLQGISASTGAALGPFHIMAAALPKPSSMQSGSGAEFELDNLSRAIKAVSNELGERAERSEGLAQEILYATQEMTEDSALFSEAESLLAKGHTAAYSIWEAAEIFTRLLINAGGYLAERASDVANIRDRIICVLSGVEYPEIPLLNHGFVLIARDLSPADTTDLKPGQILAIVTEEGGPTSHTAIIARTLGIPAIVACTGVIEAARNDVSNSVGVDARAGVITFNPSQELALELAALTKAIENRRLHRPLHGADGYQTTDGFTVPIYANVGRFEDVNVAVESGADGIGLLRTELLYLDRKTP
ncbi:MAG: phosphoenolpyruvate--protein phosphotransferase, partial [Actinobacteria bacterium]|nr:phosphoenolpyruvate--protein phosphotransferase [Actinomycetota bacterium]